MRAVCWYASGDVRVENVPDPQILNPRDAIVRVSSTAICGSDLHLYGGFIPGMQQGDVLGHEFMGEIVDVGREVKNLRPGDRVVVPFAISCGRCFFCSRELFSLCDNSNPNSPAAEKVYGHSPAGMFGYSHLTGGYAGGQAEFVRVPFADVGGFKIDGNFTDEQVLFLGDIFPTAFMAAENCNITPGDVVAVWGCGPIGQLAVRCAYYLGASRVIAIDRLPERLAMAQQQGGAEVLNYTEVDVLMALKEMTGGRGPDACIEAVGMESHGTSGMAMYDRAAQAVRLESDRPTALRQAIVACRKGGTVSIAGVFGGFLDKMPMGAAFNKGLTFKMGQTHVHRYMKPLLEIIASGDIDPSFVVTHRRPLDDAPECYDLFREKKDGCIKVVLKTSAER